MNLADTGEARPPGTDGPASVVSRSTGDDRTGPGRARSATLVVDRPDVAADGDAVGRDAGSTGDDPVVIARAAPRSRWVAVLGRALVALALVGLVAATVALRVELGDRRDDAREAAASEARVGDGRREVAVLADAVAAHLLQGQAAADVSAADRAAQVARLADLGLTERDMERALDDAQAATAALEGRRADLSAQVERQAVEDAELQGCLTEVRQAVDAAFHATNREGVEVPATREVCRALAGLR